MFVVVFHVKINWIPYLNDSELEGNIFAAHCHRKAKFSSCAVAFIARKCSTCVHICHGLHFVPVCNDIANSWLYLHSVVQWPSPPCWMMLKIISPTCIQLCSGLRLTQMSFKLSCFSRFAHHSWVEGYCKQLALLVYCCAVASVVRNCSTCVCVCRGLHTVLV